MARAACIGEFKGDVANNTFDLVKRAKNTLVCETKRVFTNKLDNDGTLEQCKARWVLCGYSQQPGIHFDKTFLATAKATSICIFFLPVAFFDLKLKGIDVVKAFTQAMLSNADLYCEQMEGFEEYDKTAKRTSSRAMASCSSGANRAYAPSSATAPAYGERFSSKIYACVDKFVGLKITYNRDARTLTPSHELYIKNMAGRFLPNKMLRKSTMTHAWFTNKAERVSTSSKLGIATTESDSAITQGKLYLELVASTLYAATMTRPDISYHSFIRLSLET
eukprot:3454824-Pleurochrysis_carterae.AAC.6